MVLAKIIFIFYNDFGLKPIFISSSIVRWLKPTAMSSTLSHNFPFSLHNIYIYQRY